MLTRLSGSVAIWNLTTESPLLKETENEGKTFREYKCAHSH